MKKAIRKKLVLDKKVVAKLTDRDSFVVKGGGVLVSDRQISPLCMTYEPCEEAA